MAKFVSSKNIFFPYPRLFPSCRVHSAFPRRPLPALSCDNADRLLRIGCHVKGNSQERKGQVPGVRGRVTGAGKVRASMTPYAGLRSRRVPRAAICAITCVVRGGDGGGGFWASG